MHASFLYLQYFLEKLYGQINVMRIFLKIREFFSEIKFSWTRNLSEIEKNRKFSILFYFTKIFILI